MLKESLHSECNEWTVGEVYQERQRDCTQDCREKML